MGGEASIMPMPGSFGERYELRGRLWADGPHAGRLARDRLLDREVVVNIPYRPDDDGRFLEAARARARLRHVGLIPVYDLGETDEGRPFFTEPHIVGSDLQTQLRGEGDGKGPASSLPRLISTLLDACRAVAFLHTQGVLHLLLSPAEVRVSPTHREVFLSLPPAPRLLGEPDTPGSVCVVPAYSAPEQVDPERLGAPGVSADVYGLGGILFAILFGEPPNRGQPALAVIRALVQRRGPPGRLPYSGPARRCRGLARRLEPICLRSLEADRTRRHPDVSTLVDEIEAALWRCA